MQLSYNVPTGSWDIMQTRKCRAGANADANRIRTKSNMSPSPSMGDIIGWDILIPKPTYNIP